MKNKFMRIAAVMLMLCLVTTCAISGTFAKYTTEASGKDTARVAYWGFNKGEAELVIDDLFAAAYDSATGTVVSYDDKDVIAPGTKSSANFQFLYQQGGISTSPEVEYTMTIDLSGSKIDPLIAANGNIKWALYKSGEEASAVWGSWDKLIENIGKLAGNDAVNATNVDNKYTATHKANSTLPDITTAQWVVAWEWYFDETTGGSANTDEADTNMGNSKTALEVVLDIKVTATQVN